MPPTPQRWPSPDTTSSASTSTPTRSPPSPGARSRSTSPGSPKLLESNVTAGRLRFTTDFAEAADFGDLHFIGVGTPQHPRTNAADLSQVDAAIGSLAPLLTRPCTVIGKSTVPVGTAENVRTRLQALAPAGADVDLVWNPEFLREGFAVADTLTPDRIVIGVATPSGPGERRGATRRSCAGSTPR